MKTYLTFNIEKLIKKINTEQEFYLIEEEINKIRVTKQYKNKRGRPFSIELPKEVSISPQAVGLIVGEGFIGDRNFVFANSNERAIDEMIEFLNQFKLPIKMYLEISIKGKSDNFRDECLNFWQDYLKTKINKIRLRKEFYSIIRYGTIHLIINNSLISKLLKEVINESKKQIEKDKELSANYLKGIIAAEGNINIKKLTNCVYMIRISASKQSERNHYKKCLNKIGIKVTCKDMPTISKIEAKQRGWKTNKGRAGAVIISRWENFVKIFDLGLLDLHNDKKTKFLYYFLNNKFTKQFLEFEYFLNKEFSMKEAQNYFDFKGRKLDRVITLSKQKYISRRKINKVKFIYYLNKKYLNLYNKLKQESQNFTLNNPIYQ